jgi:hypothetical protein
MKAHKWQRIVVLLLLALFVGGSASGQTDTPKTESTPAEDLPNTHNMLVVGTDPVFLSHLPMFEDLDAAQTKYISPHRYQVILEVRFSSEGKDVTRLYVQDRKTHPETKMYTLEPAPFVLSRLFTPDHNAPELRSFSATVFRGHLERGGQPIQGLKNIVVTVSRIVHAEQFDPARDKPAALTYMLFGTGPEFFLAHTITKPPDFDQIVAITLPEGQMKAEALNHVESVVFPDNKNLSSQRLTQGQHAQGRVHVTGAQQSFDIEPQVGSELYFEEGELAVPANFEQTPEERKAGF